VVHMHIFCQSRWLTCDILGWDYSVR